MSFAKVHFRIIFVKRQYGHCLLLLPLHRHSRLFSPTLFKNITNPQWIIRIIVRLCTLNSLSRLIFPAITCGWHFSPWCGLYTPLQSFFREGPQLPGPHCGDVHWSMAGTAVLSLFTGKLEKRAFLAVKREGKGYQLTSDRSDVNLSDRGQHREKAGTTCIFCWLAWSQWFFVCLLLEEWKWLEEVREYLYSRFDKTRFWSIVFTSLHLLGLKT